LKIELATHDGIVNEGIVNEGIVNEGVVKDGVVKKDLVVEGGWGFVVNAECSKLREIKCVSISLIALTP
jgi:hypothetical protein